MKHQVVTTADPRPAARIHSARCDCLRCRTAAHPDPRERRVRVAMFGLAAVIGALLGCTVTPQAIVAAVAHAVRAEAVPRTSAGAAEL